MAISKYGSINEDGDSNDRENREVRSNHIHVEESQRYSNLRQAIAGKFFFVYIHFITFSNLHLGFFLALLSGGLFTANNFVINQYNVNVGDLLFVRMILQLTIYTSISFYR